MHTQFQVKMEKSLVVLMVGFFLAISWAAGPQLAGATRTGHPLKGILAVTPDGRGLRGDWCQWQGDSCNWSKTCCEGYCTAYTDGTCVCVGEGGTCGLQHGCCPNYKCDGYFSGTCISRSQGLQLSAAITTTSS